MKTIKIYAFALMAASGAMLTSCGDDDSGSPSLPPIGGYNNSNEIATTDLVAHWPLDGNGNERITGTAPNGSTGVTWVNGTKGQAAKLTAGYLAYPEMAALNSLPSVTISLWAKASNTGPTDGYPTMFFQMSKPGDWAGNINFMAETGWYDAAKDTLVVKGYAKIKNADGGENNQDVRNSPKPSAEDLANGHVGNANRNAGKLTHYVLTWDATNAMFKVYANGQKISNPAWESRNGGNALPLNFFTPTRPIIGTFLSVVSGTAETWQRSMTGEIDEVRVYKKALSQADIGFLYELEKAGR
jgi:hypothetical protein